MVILEILFGILLFFVGLRMTWNESRPYELGVFPNILCGLGLLAVADGVHKLLGSS